MSDVNIHFLIKDRFKNAFRTAKWDAARKTWTVPAAAEQKAAAWLAERQHALRFVRRIERIRQMPSARHLPHFQLDDDHPDYAAQIKLARIEAGLLARMNAELDALDAVKKAGAKLTKAQKEEAARAARHAEANEILDGARNDIDRVLDSVEFLITDGELNRETLAAARAPVSSARIAASRLGVISPAIEAVFVAPEAISPATLAAARTAIDARKVIK